MAGKSRVNREVQARFCEGLGVKFPGPTRPGLDNRFQGCRGKRTPHHGTGTRSFSSSNQLRTVMICGGVAVPLNASSALIIRNRRRSAS